MASKRDPSQESASPTLSTASLKGPGESPSLRKERRRSIFQSQLLNVAVNDIFNDNHAVKTAIIQCSVNIFGLLFVLILYYNYILLQPYFYAFLWALLLSIPLHGLKRLIISIISTTFDDSSQAASPSVWKIILTILKVIGKVSCLTILSQILKNSSF